SLAEEPFPIEMREHRRPRQPVAATPPPPEPALQAIQPVQQNALTSEPMLIDRVTHALAEKIVIDQNMAPVSREQYRRLAAVLHHAQLDGTLAVLMVTSALPSEGKTLTCSNLALTFSESYQRNVLLIDADLRRPGLHNVFGIDNSSGLSDGLAADHEPKIAIRQVSPHLSILPAGSATSDPMARLTSERMRTL